MIELVTQHRIDPSTVVSIEAEVTRILLLGGPVNHADLQAAGARVEDHAPPARLAHG
jgi:hypothetical protein